MEAAVSWIFETAEMAGGMLHTLVEKSDCPLQFICVTVIIVPGHVQIVKHGEGRCELGSVQRSVGAWVWPWTAFMVQRRPPKFYVLT